MATAAEWLSGHVKRDHEWLLGRLRSLDNCLDNILYFGELGGDMRGFAGLPCPKCGEPDRAVVDLEDVSQVHCLSCDAEYPTDDVRDLIAAWTPALAWLDTCPVRPE